MKTIFIFVLMVMGTHLALGQISNNRNYLIKRIYKDAGANSNDVGKVITEVNYFDGLGRAIQKVTVGQSRDGSDVIETLGLDEAGRTKYKYLPYEATGTGKFQDNAATAVAGWYTTDNKPGLSDDRTRPYSEIFYESSPIGRSTGVQAPATKSKRTNIKYKINTANTIKRYDYDPSTNTVSQNGFFGAGMLSQLNYKDEQDHETNEYTDMLGLLICKMVETGGGTLATYYVYDNFRLLRAVLQPNFQDDPNFDRAAFVYGYDDFGKMISKSIPGSGKTEYVYDRYNRPLLHRDANQKARNMWGFTKFDGLNRPVAMGEIASTTDQLTWTNNIFTQLYAFESRDNGVIAGYSLNQTEPKTATVNDLLTITFYDDYGFQKAGTLSYNAASGFYPSAITSAKNLTTGSRARILKGDQIINGEWLTTVNHYDSEYRTIQTARELHNLGTGAYERISSEYKYNVADVTARRKTENFLSGAAATTTHLETFSYDHADRLLNVLENVKNGTMETQAYTLAQRYNPIGQLKSRWFHSDDGVNYRYRTDLTYNIRSWVTNSNTMYKEFAADPDLPLYSMGFSYNAGNNFTNGNMSSTEWGGKNLTAYEKGMNFVYDNAERLKEATGGTYNSVVYGNTETGIQYDKNGNLLKIKRSGFSSDDLTFSYTLNGTPTGNRVASVTDASATANTAVKSGLSAFTYDANGNMLTDGNKGIATTYSFMNLPRKLTVGSGGSAKNFYYDYDASGLKHQYATDTTKVKYAKHIEYREVASVNKLQRVGLTEGQAVIRKDKIEFYYYIKDQLQNTRVVFDKEGIISQLTDYYPFGLDISADPSGTSQQKRNFNNQYLANSKEIQASTGYLDFGARMYMPELGRWSVIDPLSEKTETFSPYAYANNNPITMLDIDGRYAVSIHYKITYNALLGQGYSRKQADLIAHYASTYADHPGSVPMLLDISGHGANASSNPIAYRMSSGIDYSKTAQSQEESNSQWHSMMSDAESEGGMTEEQAMNRGLRFGWDNIFGSEGGKDLGKLGQGLHALQDAFAHQGMKTSDHLGYNFSSLKQTVFTDMFGSTREASSITKSALIVADLLRGKKAKLRNGDVLNVKGMSSEQLNQVMELLIKQGFHGNIQTN